MLVSILAGVNMKNNILDKIYYYAITIIMLIVTYQMITAKALMELINGILLIIFLYFIRKFRV